MARARFSTIPMRHINRLARTANLATNYFAIAHPSLTNYLEVVGGPNFGVLNDNCPDWHSTACTTSLASGVASTEHPASPARICPIRGVGIEAATPAVDMTNQSQSAPGTNDIDGVQAIAAASNIIGKTIADQLAERGMRWKTYQESLPLHGPDGIDYSDGVFDNTTNFSAIHPTLNPPFSPSGIVALYAAKHNPFEYFRITQEGRRDVRSSGNSSANNVDFEGHRGLYADLQSDEMPTFFSIAQISATTSMDAAMPSRCAITIPATTARMPS